MKSNHIFLSLGFRPFFLAAALFAAVSIAVWMAMISFGLELTLMGMNATQWHAHEMIYGYSIAVIAGFLLTAVRNWTSIDTLKGIPLLILVSIWWVARLAWLFGTQYMVLACLADMLFMSGLVVAISVPLMQAGKTNQVGIWSKLFLLVLSNGLFYLGYFEVLEQGIRWGLYSGLYLVLALILAMGRRVIPGFIERGIQGDGGPKLNLVNYLWVDRSMLVLFVLFVVCDVFLLEPRLAAIFAAGLLLLTSIRLYSWYAAPMWSRPLLWSLYLSLCFINLGFALYTASALFALPIFLALHSFAYGGIGLITLSMMARVSLGHSGRNVLAPPRVLYISMWLLAGGAICRVIVAGLQPTHYHLWLMVSAVCWILAFTLFLSSWWKILTSQRLAARSL